MDHIAIVYNTLKAKYGKGLHWIMAGDTNELKLGPILRLNANLASVVKNPTRINHKNPSKSTILDNIITDLHKWYQEPKCLPPIDPDNENGKPSDHLTVVFEPLNVINNIPARQKREIILRPITESAMKMFGMWLRDQTWEEIKEAHAVNMKVHMLHNSIVQNVNNYFPEKKIKVTSDDSPWCNSKVKRMKRLKSREYNKHRSSDKWRDLDSKYKDCLSQGKIKFYKNMISDLKQSNPAQWYSKLKRICSYDQERYEPLVCSKLENLTDQEQAEKIADHFCSVRQQFDAVDPNEIVIPKYDINTIPQFTHMEVKLKLKEINPKKAVPEGDIPPKLLKIYAEEFSTSLTDIINSSIRQGIWPQMWKKENVTPVAKVFPPKLLKNLRSISGLMSFNKIQEKLISELIISDIKENMDPSQYGNEYGLSIQHYLVKMINKTLTDTDTKGMTAVLASLTDPV